MGASAGEYAQATYGGYGDEFIGAGALDSGQYPDATSRA
jgi:hypothetical protein